MQCSGVVTFFLDGKEMVGLRIPRLPFLLGGGIRLPLNEAPSHESPLTRLSGGGSLRSFGLVEP